MLGVAFMVRAFGDMIATGGSTLSWLSPLGWSLQTAPYVHDRWWPLTLLVVLTAGTIAAGFALASLRDFGSGMIPARRGRSQARPYLGTSLGLAWRLLRGGLVGWGAVIVVFAAVDGLFAQAMLDAAADLSPMLLEMFGGASGMADGYLAFLAEFSGYMSSAYVVFAMQGLLVEENRGRAEMILATATSRTTWAGSYLAVIAANVAVIMSGAAVAAGVGFAAVTGGRSAVATSIVAHLNMVTAILVVLGVAALLFGWAPRLLMPFGWALVGLVIVAGLFGPLLDLPDWVLDFSPLRHPATIPVQEFALTPVLVLAGIALLGTAIGLLGLRRREVVNKG